MRWGQALGQNEHTQYCFLPPPLPITARQPHPGLPVIGVPLCPEVPVLPGGVCCACQLRKSCSGWFLMAAVNFPCLSNGSGAGSALDLLTACRGCGSLEEGDAASCPSRCLRLWQHWGSWPCMWLQSVSPGLWWEQAPCSQGCFTQRARCQHRAALQPRLWPPGTDLVIPAPRTRCCFGLPWYLLPNSGAGLCPARAAGVEA